MTQSYVDNPFKSPLTAISIGPGILGIERGVERVARLIHVAYVEIEAYIIENLVTQMERRLLAPAVIWSDAKTLPCEPFRGLVDILFAGYPCQPFSTAGKRKGVEDPRHLYPYIERAIRIIRPRVCFFENVRGHITCGLPEVIESLEGLGYRVHWGIYSAEETGAAHKRERVFILAVENSTGFRCGSQWTESKGLERSSIIDNAGDELDHPHVARLGRIDSGGLQSEVISNSELSDPNHQRCGEEREREERINKSSVDVVMADIESTGLQRGYTEDHSEGLGGIGRMQATWSCVVARPDEPQNTWESPRTIITSDSAALLGGYGKKYPKSFSQEQIDQVAFDGFTGTIKPSLGLSAHGYHFREDILRALGNSVYADTAELAFRDLIRKHGIKL